MWRLRNEPWSYEYQPIPLPAAKPEMPAEAKPSIGALLLLALLELIFSLPESGRSGIEGGTNTNALERIAKS